MLLKWRKISVYSLIVFALGLFEFSQAQGNNVCSTIEDYKTMDENPNCWFDSIVNSTVPEIITQSGRPLKIHKVTTNDGHILTMFRLPNNKRKNPIFLQHGLITTCANWVSLGEDSLAFQLYDHGYDVWMGNYRGTQYSQEHVNYTVDDNEFWDHGLDEVSLDDIPSMLKHIAKETNTQGKIVYIGHSLGTTVGLMYTADQTDEALKLLALQIYTAPAYTLTNLRWEIVTFAQYFVDIIYSTVNQIDGLSKIISKEKTSKGLVQLVCTDSPQMMSLCINIFFSIYGSKTGIYPDKYPMYFQQHPSGTSFKLLKHIGDLPRNRFRKFDYGFSENINKYGTPTPPNYDISKIRIPTIVILAKNDGLSPKEDALNLYRHLSPIARKAIFEVTEENFNHIDFMFGSKAKTLYVDKVQVILDKYLPN